MQVCRLHRKNVAVFAEAINGVKHIVIVAEIPDMESVRRFYPPPICPRL